MISEENSDGLIPVALSEFVEEGHVQVKKLWTILNKVESAWKKWRAQLEEFQKSENWLTLDKRIDLPVRELHENFRSVTESRKIETERDKLREENTFLKSRMTYVVDLLFNLSPDSPTLSEQVEIVKFKVGAGDSKEGTTAVLKL